MDSFVVTKDGQHRFGPDTYNRCWEFIHKCSNGNSVDWLCKYEGWAITLAQPDSTPVPQPAQNPGPNGPIHPSCY